MNNELTVPSADTEAVIRPRMRPVLRLLVRPLARTIAVLILVSTIAIGLASVYPIQHELDIAGFRNSTFTSEAAIEIQRGEEDAVQEELGGADVAIGSYLNTGVSVGNRYFDKTEIFIITKRTSQDVTLMPSSTLLSSVEVPGDDWIDISADIAQALGVSAGDEVSIQVAPGEQASLTVRGIYAVRESGVAGYGQVPVEAVSDLIGEQANISTVVFTTASTQQTDEMLNGSVRAAQLEAGGYTRPFESVSRTDLLALATEQSTTGLGLILAVALSSLLALVIFVVRECMVYLREADGIGKLLDDLGVPRKTTLRLALTLVIPGALGSLFLGALLSKIALSHGFIVPGFPPTMTSQWWGTVAITGISSVAIAAASAPIFLRRSRG